MIIWFSRGLHADVAVVYYLSCLLSGISFIFATGTHLDSLKGWGCSFILVVFIWLLLSLSRCLERDHFNRIDPYLFIGTSNVTKVAKENKHNNGSRCFY